MFIQCSCWWVVVDTSVWLQSTSPQVLAPLKQDAKPGQDPFSISVPGKYNCSILSESHSPPHIKYKVLSIASSVKLILSCLINIKDLFWTWMMWPWRLKMPTSSYIVILILAVDAQVWKMFEEIWDVERFLSQNQLIFIDQVTLSIAFIRLGEQNRG